MKRIYLLLLVFLVAQLILAFICAPIHVNGEILFTLFWPSQCNGCFVGTSFSKILNYKQAHWLCPPFSFRIDYYLVCRLSAW